ncbi:hypothetical protein CampHawk_231 [Bacillus phage CampHawk]|uniref:Uncharacterized protein n=1 Tax=Bacillus phage CampHawk TaxID=1406783 RepID=U5PWS2_9CAUD|nr:hypothetical protein CampHawk_30 [Bacillus phage CampHawk]YP_008770165.1 hypothetical protein CampHawk_231 [Bacillus phage CampHawk]AGY46908.1 hypothetical protein CampHawk_30 [Bacillus phage CampHawk]AGY47109.1 hypothetical protein CampHawk_231 [Bacillus phage CampHawk]
MGLETFRGEGVYTPRVPLRKNIYRKYEKVVDISSHPCYNKVIENNTIK